MTGLSKEAIERLRNQHQEDMAKRRRFAYAMSDQNPPEVPVAPVIKPRSKLSVLLDPAAQAFNSLGMRLQLSRIQRNTDPVKEFDATILAEDEAAKFLCIDLHPEITHGVEDFHTAINERRARTIKPVSTDGDWK